MVMAKIKSFAVTNGSEQGRISNIRIYKRSDVPHLMNKVVADFLERGCQKSRIVTWEEITFPNKKAGKNAGEIVDKLLVKKIQTPTPGVKLCPA